MALKMLDASVVQFPSQKELLLTAFLIISMTQSVEGTTEVCDKECPVHRMLTPRLGLLNGSSTVYWFPGEDTRELKLRGEDLYRDISIQESNRRKWHAINIKSYFPEETAVTEVTNIRQRRVDGNVSVSIPSLNVSEGMSCEGLYCRDITPVSESFGLWAFNCDAPPCVCTSTRKNCSHIEHTGCGFANLTAFIVGLNTTSEIFMLPGTGASFVDVSLTHGKTMERSYLTSTFQPIKFEINVSIVEQEGTSRRECTLYIPQFEYFRYCSGTENFPIKYLMISTDRISVFAFGCTEDTVLGRKGHTSSGQELSSTWVAIVVVAVLLVILMLVAVIIYKRRQLRSRSLEPTSPQ